ncbi:MAG TPA: MarR family transcriptional regulator [Terriglobales bacterium]
MTTVCSSKRSSSGQKQQVVPGDVRRRSVVYNLLHTAGYLRRFYAELFDTRGITLTQYNVLCILRGAGLGGLPTLEVAARMFDQTPGITRLLDRLEVKRLVRRQRPSSNRRQVVCSITGKGVKLLDSLDALVGRRAEAAVQMLDGSEVDALLQSLARIRKGSPRT